MITRILGLDTGTNSLAWAVVDRDANGNYTLVKRGDVIFTEGVKIEKKATKNRLKRPKGQDTSLCACSMLGDVCVRLIR